MGYHLNKIPKGVLGEWSKIEEEWNEYNDAVEQGCLIMAMVELSDMWGAYIYYLNTQIDKGPQLSSFRENREKLEKLKAFFEAEVKKYGITEYDLGLMASLTEKSFKDGTRK